MITKPGRTNSFLLIVVLLLTGCWGQQLDEALAPVAAPVEAAPVSAAWPTQSWQTAAPESQGVDSEKLAQMLADIDQQDLNLHSLLIIRNGYLISETYFENYTPERKHELFSVTKSFMATLIGIALDQGQITSLDQKTLEFFPEENFENIDERKRAMTLEHLLTMTSGLDWEEGDRAYWAMYRSSDWTKQVLDLPMSEAPGERGNYCSGCSHVLSAILQAQTGTTTQAFAEEYLFNTLGINDFTWETDAVGNAIGGWGLKITPRQMAKLGYLYLQRGNWDGIQVVSEDWVKQATRMQVASDAGEDEYGYQWWILPALSGYAALGLGGQTVFVAPAVDLVVVTTAEINGHEAIFGLIEAYILPAIDRAGDD